MTSPVSSSRSELAEFKRLIFKQEHHSLRALKDRVSEISEAEHLGEILPGALSSSRQADGELLAESLREPLVDAMALSVKQDKESISSALFPILGPAIRLYVGELFRNMTDQLNETIKSATSAKQLKWRLQAKMAGKSYAEYVLLKTQNYRIDRIFLISTESGLPLRHLSREENVDESADLVSGMLVAIRSFAKDSFSQGEEDAGELKRFSFGDQEIYIEVGPTVIVAAVGRGTPPAVFHEKLSETVEKIHHEEEESIRNWNGDPSVFDHLHSDLSALMMESRGDSDAGTENSSPWPMRIFLLVLGLCLGSWIAFSVVNRLQWGKGIEALQATPGIEVVSSSKTGWNRMAIHLLIDPTADSPAAVLGEAGCDVERAELRISPFLSLDEPMATERNAKQARIEQEHRTEIRNLAHRVDVLRDELTLAEKSVKNLRENALTGKDIEPLQVSDFFSRFAVSGAVAVNRVNETWKISGKVDEPIYSKIIAESPEVFPGAKIDHSALVDRTRLAIAATRSEIESLPLAYITGTSSMNETHERQRSALHARLQELDRLCHLDGAALFDIHVHALPLVGTFDEGNKEVITRRLQSEHARLREVGIAPERLRFSRVLSPDPDRTGIFLILSPPPSP